MFSKMNPATFGMGMGGEIFLIFARVVANFLRAQVGVLKNVFLGESNFTCSPPSATHYEHSLKEYKCQECDFSVHKMLCTRFFYKEPVYKEPTCRRPKYLKNLYY